MTPQHESIAPERLEGVLPGVPSAPVEAYSSDDPLSTDSQVIRLPASCFYWAVVEVADVPGALRANRGQRLRYAFENVIPVDVDDVHPVFVPMESGRFLGCAMPLTEIERYWASGAGGGSGGGGGARPGGAAHTLVPDSMPDFIRDLAKDSIEPEAFNMLCGRFEPSPVTRLRRRSVVVVGAALAFCTLLCGLGLVQRTANMDIAAARVQEAAHRVIADALGPEATVPHGQPAELALVAELRRIRQTRERPLEELRPKPCVEPLLALLEAWPARPDLPICTEAVSITPTAITIRATTTSSQHAQEFIAALAGALTDQKNGQPSSPGPGSPSATAAASSSGFGSVSGGWVMAQPQVQASKDSVQVTLQWRRDERMPT